MWIGEDGVLRRVSAQVAFPGGAGAPMNATGVAFELSFSGFGEPFPVSVPPPGTIADLASLPASVLLPLPDCVDAAASLLGPGTTVPPALREVLMCMDDARERAAAGRTVAEWLADPAALMPVASCPVAGLAALAGGGGGLWRPPGGG